MTGAEVVIRRASDADAAAIADVYLRAFHATYNFPLAHTDVQVRGWIGRLVAGHDEAWVALEDERIVGMMVMAPGELDQLYVAPDRHGVGIGRRLLDTAKERSPAGLALSTFQVNERARRFYERNGFVIDALGDGSGNEEGQPDVRYVWGSPPDQIVVAPDGVRIALFRSGGAGRWGAGVVPGAGAVPGQAVPGEAVPARAAVPAAVSSGGPIVLVHGATADHTTWRTSGPLLAARHPLHAIDRRGRGASGDGDPGEPYAIEREFDDLAAVVDAVAREAGGPVDVVGHSYGGRIALGAALRTASLRRLVCYEGAPPAEGRGYQPEDAGTVERIAALVAAGDRDEALATFMRDIVGMSESDLAAFRADPIWPRRAAAIDTTIRELRAETSAAASLDILGAVRQPVLQVLGGTSSEPFAAATRALEARLRNGRVVTIFGARHAAHHSHPAEFVAAVEAFLTEPDVAD